ncbi:MAG: Asp-tRNA(Asn)/Glu-tRNA(Gln) amidotransferase GatCAB subunit C [Gammaproteobacteria bacterium]|nr:Asp-tRNA(Asn)/Glu-tRNA(Gln) amidotransferase GatCAB subunit C [Gammaproteobacteria bacterium]|tara:strand:+ start:370 stop:657 length:288 start_codon:yes stop_codon:yes gene_type:complete
MAFDKTVLEQVAQLSRLYLSESEKDEVAGRITDILVLIDEMQSVNTDSVTPLAHPLDMTQRLREDQITESNRRDELQQLAPKIEDGLYLVPKVIE